MVLHFHKNNISTKINTSYNTKNNRNFDPKNIKAPPVTPAEEKKLLKFQDMGTCGMKNTSEKKIFKFEDMKLIPESIKSSVNLNTFKLNNKFKCVVTFLLQARFI